jgi:hypothetical protein
MRIRNIQVSNSKLTEGSYHHFKILKLSSLSEQSWYVMQDPLGYKVLMPAGFYSGYHFKPGMEVLCRVDRINCNGRMFLEPMHPCYKEGESYEFGLVGIVSKTGLTEETEYFIQVKDLLGYEWEVRVFDKHLLQNLKDKVRCRLERLKKGRLYLTLCTDHYPATLVSGQHYDFIITEEKVNSDNRLKYYILEDHNGQKQIINKKYYPHYGLKKGQKIRCRVDKFTSEGYYFLEPENPWYKIGEFYDFGILEFHQLIFSDGSVQNVLMIDDPHSEPVKIFVDEDAAVFGNLQKVKCHVLDFRKSRPGLKVILNEDQ